MANGSLTEFLYDGVNPVQETSGATVLANVLSGLGIDELLTRTDVPAATTSHFLPDALGSALALTDPAGALQTEYTYEPFGKTTASGISSTSPFQYTGRENDATGLYYYRARYYHPGLQRFISEDPIGFDGGDINLYSYVANSPLNLIDPTGLAHGPYHPPGPVHTACRKGDSCATIKAKIWLLQRMIRSHEGWDRHRPSPRGGGRHATEIAQLWRQLAGCQNLYEEKCQTQNPCDQTPEPFPFPLPSPGPTPGPKPFPFWWSPPIPSPERN